MILLADELLKDINAQSQEPHSSKIIINVDHEDGLADNDDICHLVFVWIKEYFYISKISKSSNNHIYVTH